jgi:F-type H+-transporting ATPase subunit gamma
VVPFPARELALISTATEVCYIMIPPDKTHSIISKVLENTDLEKNEYNVVGTYDQLFDSLTFENIIPVAEKIMKSFANKEYDKVEIIYNEFKNAAKQVLTTEQFLPVIFDHTEILEKKGNKIPTDFIFEPNKEKIINELIPRTLKIQFYKALLDSNASEQGARMTAMHIATDNATEMLKDLKLSYNKARQATITKEMLEIVSGAEALKG